MYIWVSVSGVCMYMYGLAVVMACGGLQGFIGITCSMQYKGTCMCVCVCVGGGGDM